jgi:hypothetical protein
MCGCFVILLGAVAPRLAIVFLELFTDYPDRAFDSFWMGFVGFLFLPYTTLAFILMDNWGDPINGFGWFVVALGFIVDVSSYVGTSARGRRQIA